MRRPGEKTIASWERRAEKALHEAQAWGRMIEDGQQTGLDAHRLGVWRSKMIAERNKHAALLERIAKAGKQ